VFFNFFYFLLYNIIYIYIYISISIIRFFIKKIFINRVRKNFLHEANRVMHLRL